MQVSQLPSDTANTLTRLRPGTFVSAHYISNSTLKEIHLTESVHINKCIRVIIASCRTELRHETLKVIHGIYPGGKRKKTKWVIWHISTVYKDTNTNSAVFQY